MKLNLFLSFLGGIMYAWGFPVKNFFSCFIFPIIGFAFLYYSLDKNQTKKNSQATTHKKTLKEMLLLIIAFDLGYFLLGFYWIITLLHNFGGITAPWNYLLATASSLLLTPHYFIFIFIFKYLANIKKRNRIIVPIWLTSILTSAVLVLLEQIVPQEFPAHIGHPWLQIAPHLGLAPYLGAPIYSFISYLTAITLVQQFQQIKQKKSDQKLYFNYFVITLLVSLNFIIPLPKQVLKNKKLKIRVVQANIENDLKLNSEKTFLAAQKVKNIYYNLSTKENDQIDLIIWPETAYPKLLISKLVKDNKRFVPPLIKKVISSTNAYLLTGGYDQKGNMNRGFFETVYNSAFLFNPNLELQNIYYKHILIPFGETLPFGPLNKYIKNINSNISFFAKGKSQPFFKLKDSIFSMAICYEILYPHFLKKYFIKRKPDFIVNLTNDSWYGDTSEPFQHLFLARWRALEWQIPIVRVTNTGITALINFDGSYKELIPLNSRAYQDFVLKY